MKVLTTRRQEVTKRARHESTMIPTSKASILSPSDAMGKSIRGFSKRITGLAHVPAEMEGMDEIQPEELSDLVKNSRNALMKYLEFIDSPEGSTLAGRAKAEQELGGKESRAIKYILASIDKDGDGNASSFEIEEYEETAKVCICICICSRNSFGLHSCMVAWCFCRQ